MAEVGSIDDLLGMAGDVPVDVETESQPSVPVRPPITTHHDPILRLLFLGYLEDG